ncbi:MAG: mechanosensitive ion channel family protein [Bacteroidetes bacterium]|nr:mechanosensitive ion channel family protein [Bacteroidota bacterium]
MKKTHFLVLAGFLHVCTAYGQGPKDSLKKDTSRPDSTRTAENLLLQHQEQQMIDSAIRRQLLIELKQSTGNALRTKELQQQLSDILTRDSLRKEEQVHVIQQLKTNARPHPVILNYDTLFPIFTRIGSFNAGDRADAISRRIQKLYDDFIFMPDSLRLNPTQEGYDIIYTPDQVIMTVTQLDALWFNVGTDSLARYYLGTIKSAVVREKSANSVQNWLKRIGLSLLIAACAALVVILLNRLFRRSALFIHKKRDKHLKGLVFRKIQLLTPARMEQLALSINNIARIIAIILSVYLSLLLLSGVFRATRRWTDTLLSWILTPARAALHGVVKFLPNLFTILVIWIIFRYLARAIRYFSDEVEKGHIQINGFHKDWAHPTYNIIRFLLYAFMLVIVFPYLPGSDSLAFKGVTVFLGILFSLGSSSAITNLVAGLVITYMRPFKVGDRVRIGDVTGDVVEKNMLVTRIRTIKNEDITVPNSTVLGSSAINYSANTGPEDKGLIMHTTVTIGYDVPWKQMHEALLTAAGRTALVLKDPPPFVLQTSLDDFYISYQLNVYTKEANKQASIQSELHQHILDSCNEAGIEIMSPHYRAMRDGNETTIPPNHR